MSGGCAEAVPCFAGLALFNSFISLALSFHESSGGEVQESVFIGEYQRKRRFKTVSRSGGKRGREGSARYSVAVL